MSDTARTALVRAAASTAIETAGGGAELARLLGLTRFAVHQWKMSGIPARQVGRVAAITGLNPHFLRPDLWPQTAPAAPPSPQVAA